MNEAPETLLAEARWLERMARSLVADPHLAADLAQDTWLAMQSAPPPRGERRPWLLGVLRNLARRAFRSGGRRQQRELARAADTAAEATADLLARTELHSRLLQLVRELPESYRAPLLLRFFDDLPPRRIAARLGLPVDTVHTRIRRGLAELRSRLDAEHGGERRAWVALLLRTTPPAPPTLLPGASVVAAAAITLAVVAATIWPREPVPPPRASLANPTAAAPARPAPLGAPERELRSLEPPRDGPLALLRGSVVDWDGRPIADAAITIAPHLGIHWGPEALETVELDAGPATTLPTHSDRDGTFTLPRPTGPIELRAVAKDHTCVAVGIWRPETDYVPRIVLARAATRTGRVVDELGLPVAAASVQLALPTAGGGAGTLRGLHLLTWRATTGADGGFELLEAPVVDGAPVQLTKHGHEPQVVPFASANGLLTLPRWTSSFATRVVDGLGQPIAGAIVAGARTTATTDADGRCELPGPRGPLHVAAPGRRPTAFAAAAGNPLALLDADQALSGRLLLADGQPAAGWSISLMDPTCVGDPQALVVLEAVAAGNGTLVHRTTTDGDGRFRLAGLADRAYRLRCVDGPSAATFVTPPLAPGSTHVLALPALVWLPELSLALRTPDGAPLPLAQVSVQGTAYGLPVAGGERTVLFSQGTDGRTDQNGRVTLRRVPREHVHLRVQHPSTGVVTVPIADALQGPLVLPRQGELLVRDRQPGASRWFELCAADGSVVAVECVQGVCTRRAARWPLVDGRSPVLTVPETVTTLRYGDATGELGQQPLLVRPGALVSLDL